MHALFISISSALFWALPSYALFRSIVNLAHKSCYSHAPHRRPQ